MSHLSKVSKIDTTKSPVSKVDLKDLPSLVKLLLQYNRFDSLEIEDMPNLEELYLSNCELLTSLSIKNMGKLSRLDMEGCPVANLSDLPSSVKLLWVDRQAVASYDFVELVNLERLKIDNGKAVRSELLNLRKEVKLAPEGVRIDENADDW
jgi:Leucine-rich repeat (LRR) protein